MTASLSVLIQSTWHGKSEQKINHYYFKLLKHVCFSNIKTHSPAHLANSHIIYVLLKNPVRWMARFFNPFNSTLFFLISVNMMYLFSTLVFFTCFYSILYDFSHRQIGWALIFLSKVSLFFLIGIITLTFAFSMVIDIFEFKSTIFLFVFYFSCTFFLHSFFFYFILY